MTHILHQYNDKKCLSLLSFKEYCLSFIHNKELTFIDGWGWFLDIEENKDKKLFYFYDKFNNRQIKHALSIPTTIKEISKLRSRKSLINLNEHYYIEVKKTSNTNKIINIIFITGLIYVFWGLI